MKTEKGILFIIGAITLIIFMGIVLFSLIETKNQQKGQVISYSKSDTSRPKVWTSGFFADFGNMKVNEEKTAEFTIKNNGDKTLALFDIKTSCDCAFGQVVTNGAKSPEFSMHGKSSWVGEVKSEGVVTLRVIYRPSIMPVQGIVTREVYVSTNDPDNPKLTFTIKAFVE